MQRITEYLINARAKYPEKIGMLSEVSSYTYDDIYKYSNYVAEYLKMEYKLNCDLVIIHACNSCELGIIMYALLAANCTVIPVSVVCSDQELNYIINDSKSILLIADEYTTNKYQHIYTDSQINIDSVMRLISLAEQNASGLPMTQADKKMDNELAFIIYSSGSTGKLKGIKCTHKAILFVVHAINEFIRNNEKDTILCALPFSFDYGLYQLFLVAEAYATAFIHPQIFNALQIPYLIQRNQITGFPALPMWLKMLLENNRIDISKMSSLRYITSTGDVLKVSVIDELSKKMPHLEILCMYGLTECKRVSILPWEDYQTHKGSVGLPLRGTAVRIVDENGADVPSGEIGELVVRGPHLMQGYFRDEEMTKDRYRYNNKYNEMELFTGDIFKMDQQGYLYYITRTQFYIKKRGQRISPFFIEDTINKIQNVIESAVVPLRVKDDELTVGFIRINRGTYPAAILSHMKKSLPKVNHLDYVIFYDKFFPHTANGKIDRKALIDKAKLLYLDNEMSNNEKKGEFTLLNDVQKLYFQGEPFIIYNQGGSCCNKYVNEIGVFVKEIDKNVEGVDNGFQKFYYEIKHIQRASRIFNKLYPEIISIKDDNKKYSVEMEYCYNGITFGDLIRNETVDQEYLENSFNYILSNLFSEMYSKVYQEYNPNYITDNFINRVKKRIDKIKQMNIQKEYGFSAKLLDIIDHGVYLNGEYYPSIFKYIEFIENDRCLIEKLSIYCTTESHHDLIPSNILVDIASSQNCISGFKLIDPRGEIETGKLNRHFVYDMGKMLLGIDTLDIFRIFNGKISNKSYYFKYCNVVKQIHGFELYFYDSVITQRYRKLSEIFWSIMDNNNYFNISSKDVNANIRLQFQFSHVFMYHPDVSCRIICEKDEELAICIYLRGLMMLRKFMDFAYGRDPLRNENNHSELDIWPLVKEPL